MDLVHEQKLLEIECVKRGKARYFTQLESSTARGREFDGSVASNIIRDPLHKLEAAIRKLKIEARAKLVMAHTTGQRLGGWEMPLLALDSKAIAYIAFKSVLVAGRDQNRIQRVAQTAGRMINYEVRWAELRKAETQATKDRGGEPRNRIERMKREVSEVNPKSLRQWLKKLDDLVTIEWGRKVHFTLGTAIVHLMLQECSDVVEEVWIKKSIGGRRVDRTVISLHPKFLAALHSQHSREAMNKPWWLPMVAVPNDWKIDDEGTIRGGYLKNSKDGGGGFKIESIIKTIGYQHTQPTMEEVGQATLDAVNRVQSTAWKINTRVVELADHAVGKGLGPCPFEPALLMPDNVSAEIWAKMDRKERGAIKGERERVHTHNNRMKSKESTAHRVVNVALDFKDRDAIYFPHTLDWRGRAYPQTQDLHPQADDFAKSMLTFAEGKPLGEMGLQWLAFHMANCYGMDKVDRQGQVDWVNEWQCEIFDVAADPFGEGLEFWSKADEPWQFLAAAIEYCSAWAHPVEPEFYISHLPVHVDGSCNGLQHLSAMGLDPVGAEAVNLMPGPRQDIYQIVADKVVEAIHAETYTEKDEASDPAAFNWVGNVTRKTVKRGVMTTPYGLTPIGMRDQLIKDRMCDPLEGDRMLNANYLRDRMKEAIDDTIVKGTEIMAWFQDCADILAAQDKGIMWTTPIGMRVTQHYSPFSGHRVTTLMGRFVFNKPPTREGVQTRKQKLSIAPNIIHSFDAAHMLLSVLNSPDDFSFSVIHDSFGCHAGDMKDFIDIIRETFVDIYKTDWFAIFTTDLKDQGAVHLTPAPVRGTLEIEDVLGSEFFFA